MTYEKIVIPMDHGNRNMKTKEDVFTSGLEESDMKPILGDYLMYDGVVRQIKRCSIRQIILS